MKKFIFSLVTVLLLSGLLGGCTREIKYPLKVTEKSFPDNAFRNYLKTHFGDDITEEEALETVFLDVSDLGIETLKGIEVFGNLSALNCACNKLRELDVSSTKLRTLICYDNKLEELVLPTNGLETLDCSCNKLSKLDLRENNQLTNLECYANKLKAINVKNCADLKYLDCSFNPINRLSLDGNEALLFLDCSYMELKNLELSTNTELKALWARGNNLGEIYTKINRSLVTIECDKDVEVIR